MNIKQISLQHRIQQFRAGYPLHPEYMPALLRSVALCPALTYFASCPEELINLSNLLHLPDQDIYQMTYQDIALHIRQLYAQKHETAAEAARIMATPLVQIYEKWAARHNQTN